MSVLYRSPESPGLPREEWIIGKRTFSTYPTEEQLAEFLRYIDWDYMQGFRVEFEGKQRMKAPNVSPKRSASIRDQTLSDRWDHEL
jgi:hypothetical protein